MAKEILVTPEAGQEVVVNPVGAVKVRSARISSSRAQARVIVEGTYVEPPPPLPVGASLADYGGNWTTAMAAAKDAGNVLFVPAGVWPAFQVKPHPGLTIKGEGPTSIIARNQPGPLESGGVIDVTAPDVSLRDLTIRGYPAASGKSDDMGIHAKNAARLKVQRVNIVDMQGAGIFTEGSTTGGTFEDISITNTMFRSNGYHGVAVWCYMGSSGNTYRRISIDGVDFVGLFFDAGTSGSTTAAGANDNVVEDIVIRNAGRKPLPNNAAIGAGFMLTGGARNTITRWEVTDQRMGAAIAFGVDQSGIGSTGNVFTTGVIARIASGDAIGFGSTSGNTIDGGTGTGRVTGNKAGNTVRNWPGLT